MRAPEQAGRAQHQPCNASRSSSSSRRLPHRQAGRTARRRRHLPGLDGGVHNAREVGHAPRRGSRHLFYPFINVQHISIL